ncbi:MAG TPA: hypothetical protein VMB18_19590 [Terriglobales bacterium]|nr:hypothetical protein [Terriglobales bacterium]
MTFAPHSRGIFFSLLVLHLSVLASGEQIPVKFPQGSIHAFMVLRSEEGKAIGVGDWDQKLHSGQLSSHLKFRFDDGSIYEDTTTFTQKGVFRVLSDHLLESGPTFKDTMEVWTDCRSGQVKVRQSKDGKDKDKVTTQHLNIPADVANGILSILLANLADGAKHTLSMVVAAPKPRIVKLVVSPQSEDEFSIQKTQYKAKTYLVHIDIGGVAGAVAPLVGKQPQDTRVWVLKADVPIFLRSVGPLSAGAPVIQIDLAGPTWPESAK